MNTHFAGMTSAALVVGLAGSVAAYRSQVVEDLTVDKPSVVSSSTKPIGPDTRVRWAPCSKGSRLEAGACVTHKVRTVVVPAAPIYVPAPPAAPVAAPAAAPVATPPTRDQDEGNNADDDQDGADQEDADHDGEDHDGEDHDGEDQDSHEEDDGHDGEEDD